MEKVISIIIPAYNEQENVSLVAKAIKDVFQNIQNYNYRILFVDDGSTDNTLQKIKELSAQDNHICYLEFSRNFGKEIATTAGIQHCQGDACIMVDADLQHPVDLIPKFIAKWEKGADIVTGIREKNKNEGWIKKVGSYFFYKIINAIGDVKVVPRATDFRLLDKKVIKEYKRFTEKERMTRALIDWMGFKRDYIYFNANERANGEASYSKFKLLKLALNSFVSYSLFPLRLAGYLGFLIIFTFGPAGLFILVGKYFLNNSFAWSFSGPAQLAILLAFLIGIILVSLGLISFYIAAIHREVLNRPLYVVRESKFD